MSITCEHWPVRVSLHRPHHTCRCGKWDPDRTSPEPDFDQVMRHVAEESVKRFLADFPSVLESGVTP